eukprot:1155322-Pelagomonas_calceolata.AAC.2
MPLNCMIALRPEVPPNRTIACTQAGGMPQAPQGTGMMAAPALAGGSLADQLMALYHSPDVMCLQQGIHINDIMAKLKQSGANYSMDQHAFHGHDNNDIIIHCFCWLAL